MITGIYRSTGGVTGIISNCCATEAETHSDTQRKRGKEARREEEMTAGKYKLFRLHE
jgi:GH25 family lysozyme M1 (1,4-beta-N-acetylmuramidase)